MLPNTDQRGYYISGNPVLTQFKALLQPEGASSSGIHEPFFTIIPSIGVHQPNSHWGHKLGYLEIIKHIISIIIIIIKYYPKVPNLIDSEILLWCYSCFWYK
jgi:hypothetical protein